MIWEYAQQLAENGHGIGQYGRSCGQSVDKLSQWPPREGRHRERFKEPPSEVRDWPLFLFEAGRSRAWGFQLKSV